MALELTDPEDAKLLTLARAGRARNQSSQGAAVRDSDGRTYAATNLDLPSLQLSAVQVAVAMAASSGVQGLEAALLVTDGLAVDEVDVTVVREFGGAGIPVYRADGDGVVADMVTT
jgi:hypothetical protein